MTDEHPHCYPVPKDIDNFIYSEFPEAVAAKAYQYFQQNKRLPVTQWHNGRVYEVRRAYAEACFKQARAFLQAGYDTVKQGV